MRELSPDDMLVMAAARIARTAPESFQQLLDAVAFHHAQNERNLLMSPIDQLPTHQGRAQNSARLRELFANCKSLADKIEERKK